MGIHDKSPLWIALIISLVLCGAVSLALYLNEDWRRTTFAMLEEVVNEEGEVVKKVKVERPEPNREQVREIARNQEVKKREALKENAKKLRKTVIELEEAVEARKESLAAPDIWDEMAVRANALMEQAGLLRYWQSKSRFLTQQPNVMKTLINLRNVTERHAGTMRVLSLELEVESESAWTALYQARELVGEIEPAKIALTGAYQAAVAEPESRDQQKIVRFVTARVDEMKEFIADANAYLVDFEKLLIEDGVETADLESTPAELPESMQTDMAEHEQMSELDAESVEPEATLPSEEAFEQMETAELYESIQEMTQRMDEAFAENQAAELAEFKQISMEEAQDQVFAPITDTGPDLQEALSQNQPNSSEEFKQFNEALDQAVQSSERMKRQAESRLDKALGKSSESSQASQTAEQLRQALSKDATIKAQMAMEASNAGRGDGNLQDMRGLMGQSYQNDSHQGGEGSNLGGLGRSAIYDTSSFTAVDGADKNPDRVSLNRNRVNAQSLPGRRFDMNSERKGWIFIDTWYIIGPWSLPGGKEFEQPFPPETMVDLDATYSGKNHPVTKQPIELEWRFIQSESMRIKPPDEMSGSVYFAYTEVFSETVLDVVVAVASDDRAKLWINDLVVFQDVGLSGWQLDEGFRRVLLKPGYNTLLVRLENGPAVTNFSVLMCPFDAITR